MKHLRLAISKQGTQPSALALNSSRFNRTHCNLFALIIMITIPVLIQIVKQALRDHDRQEYERLNADGALDVVARLRAEAAIETRDYLMCLARDEALSSNLEPMDRVRRQMRKNREADEITIAQAIEFEPNDPRNRH